MKWLWISLAMLTALVALIAVIGALLPVGHAAARRIVLKAAARDVFACISDPASFPQWRDVKSVTWLPDSDGRKCFREVSGFGPMDLRIERSEPDRWFVTRIVTQGSPFGGTWTIRLDASGDTTAVTVTENGEVYNVLFRCLARFVFGHTGTIDGYLRALGRRFGQDEAPQPAEPDPPPP